MPCEDTSSRITVWVDEADAVVDYDFTKVTCSRTIGDGQSPYKQMVTGQHIDDVLAIDFDKLRSCFGELTDEDHFFLYLEWDAVRATLMQFVGRDEEIDHSRYQVLSVLHEEDGSAITQIFQPSKHMPKNIACCHSVEKKSMKDAS